MLVGGASLLRQTLREQNETRPNIYTITIDAVGIAHPTTVVTKLATDEIFTKRLIVVLRLVARLSG